MDIAVDLVFPHLSRIQRFFQAGIAVRRVLGLPRDLAVSGTRFHQRRACLLGRTFLLLCGCELCLSDLELAQGLQVAFIQVPLLGDCGVAEVLGRADGGFEPRF